MAGEEALAASRAGRVWLELRVADDFAQAVTQGRALSVVVAGLDGLSLINDRLSTEEGDAVLARFQDHLFELVGQAARIGGDEFAFSLPRTGAREAVALAERIRRSAAETIRTPLGVLRVSLGVCTYPDGAESASEMVYGAQAAMYWAKATGGNKVGYWTEIAFPHAAVWKRKGVVADTVTALVVTLERKTLASPGQCNRFAWYTKKMASALGIPPSQQQPIEIAGLLHDIGKLAIPNHILLKPGSLTDEERAIAQQHSLVGRDILRRIPFLAPAAPIVAHHHEHYDGSGYPDGLRGEDIPLGSRIILVADAIDAMTSHRAYRSSMSLQMAVEELQRCSGQQFDPRVVEAFVDIVRRQGHRALHWSLTSLR